MEVVVAKCDFADFAVDGRGVEIIRPPEFAIGAGDVNRDGNEFPRLRFGAVDGGKHGATAAVMTAKGSSGRNPRMSAGSAALRTITAAKTRLPISIRAHKMFASG